MKVFFRYFLFSTFAISFVFNAGVPFMVVEIPVGLGLYHCVLAAFSLGCSIYNLVDGIILQKSRKEPSNVK